MTRGRRNPVSWCVLGAAIAVALSASVTAAPPAAGPGLTDLIRETQKRGELPGRITVVWWLPEEFWNLSLKKGAVVGDEQQAEFLKAVRPYLIFAAVDGKVGALGGTEFVDPETIRSGFRIVDRSGRSYSPLPDPQIPADVKNLSAMMKSVLGNMLGAMGQGMSIVILPATEPDGSVIAAATREGSFSVEFAGQSFTWRLPLASLLPAKVCPIDGERMSGAWKYCPFHGKPLEDADKPAPHDGSSSR